MNLKGGKARVNTWVGRFGYNIFEQRMAVQRKYAKITLQVREKLIDMVHQQGYTFKKAADVLGINQSTARMIVRKFERDGELFEKREDYNTRIEVQKALEKERAKKEEESSTKQDPNPLYNFQSLLAFMLALNSLQGLW